MPVASPSLAISTRDHMEVSVMTGASAKVQRGGHFYSVVFL